MRNELQRFIAKVFLLSLPALLFEAWQLSLPLNQYTFRGWEALVTQNNWSASFYPDQRLTMREVGDLGAYTLNAVPRPAEWVTDQAGYRNGPEVCDRPEIVVLGDSMAAGASLTQSDALPARLQSASGRCTRSFAAGKLSTALAAVMKLPAPPHWIVIVLAERNTHVLEELDRFPDRVGVRWLDFLPPRLAAIWTHFRKNLYFHYRASHGVAATLSRSFLRPEDALPLYAPRIAASAPPEAQMLFFGNIGNKDETEAELEPLRAIVERLADRLRPQGTRVAVTFVPNKETLYPGLSGHPGSRLGERLKAALRSERFRYVDLIGAFEAEYAARHEFLHQTDDSHWNAAGVRLAAEEILKAIQP